MKFVCRLMCVLATVDLLAFAVTQPARAQDADADDFYGSGMDEVSPPPAPDIPGYAVISSADDPVPALRRKRTPVTDPFEAQGLRQGPITYYPTLEIGGIATSNVARVAAGAEADVGLRLKPGLRLESNWSRHQLTASATGEVVRYLEEEDLSTSGANVQAALRLDVRRGTRLDLEAGYTLTSTGASSTEVPDTAIGNRLSHEFRNSAALTHETGFGEVQAKAGLRREIFADVDLSGGGTEDNSDRTYTELSLSARSTFNRGAIIRPFAEVVYTPRFHDRTIDRNGLRRDSHGFSGTLGLRIDDDPVWTGEAGVTYAVRTYEDPALKTVDAPGLLANLQWRPTELTRVDLSATLGISETASAGESGTVQYGASASVTHELRDNLDLIAGTSFSAARNSGGSDETYGARAGLEWKLNPFVSWSLMYDGTWFDSAAAAGDYDDQRLMSSIILKR